MLQILVHPGWKWPNYAHSNKKIKTNPVVVQSVLELIANVWLKVQYQKTSTHNLAKIKIPKNQATKIFNTRNKKRSASKLLDSCPNIIWAPGPRLDCITEKSCFFFRSWQSRNAFLLVAGLPLKRCKNRLNFYPSKNTYCDKRIRTSGSNQQGEGTLKSEYWFSEVIEKIVHHYLQDKMVKRRSKK